MATDAATFRLRLRDKAAGRNDLSGLPRDNRAVRNKDAAATTGRKISGLKRPARVKKLSKERSE